MDERELLLRIAEAAVQLSLNPPILPNPDSLVAWEQLERGLTIWQAWLIHGNEPSVLSVRHRPCEECGTEFFFAQVAEDQWVPLELDPIPIDEVISTYRWVVDLTRNPVTATVDATKTIGQVFVDHRQTCGARKGPKHKCPPYARRYKVNVLRWEAKQESGAEAALKDLLAMRQHLTDAPADNNANGT